MVRIEYRRNVYVLESGEYKAEEAELARPFL